MVGNGLDGVDFVLLKVSIVADPLVLLERNADLSHLGLRISRELLDILPYGVLGLKRETVTHLRTGVAIDQSGSFAVAVYGRPVPGARPF